MHLSPTSKLGYLSFNRLKGKIVLNLSRLKVPIMQNPGGNYGDIVPVANFTVIAAIVIT